MEFDLGRGFDLGHAVVDDVAVCDWWAKQSVLFVFLCEPEPVSALTEPLLGLGDHRAHLLLLLFPTV